MKLDSKEYYVELENKLKIAIEALEDVHKWHSHIDLSCVIEQLKGDHNE